MPTTPARPALVLLAAVVVAAVAVPGRPAHAAVTSISLRSAVAGLPVAAEDRTGYAREKFPHWIDADGDGCNTRNEVLLAEAVTAPGTGSGCRLSAGRWYSYYDDRSWSAAADLDIDHLVALAEAWDSGARRWTGPQRRAYANDLGDARSLVAVTDDVNQSKGDRDPAGWVPPHEPARCRFITEWVAVKLRWRLTVDSAEKSTLTARANACPNVTITVNHAI